MGATPKQMTPEEKKLQRKKDLAQLKASNQMLEEAKELVMKYEETNDGEKSSAIQDIEMAQNENLQMARTYHHATDEELNNAEYHGASIKYVKKYEEHLKRRGTTDEQLRRKDTATATFSTGNDGEETVSEIMSKLKKNRVSGDGLVDGNKTGENTENGGTGKRKLKLKEKKEVIGDVEKEDSTAKEISERMDSKKTVTPKKGKSKKQTETVSSVVDFDISDIPEHVQYDIIPLPSNGECYPHKKSRIPVAYLTALDENLIASPNMYRDGKITDVILKRKILDKSINVDDLCRGDRDAILLWLRATGYGVDFPVTAINPNDRSKRYDLNVKLDAFKMLPFNLKGDENGWFEYKVSNGDVLKFKLLGRADEEKLRRINDEEDARINREDIIRYSDELKNALDENDDIADEEKETIKNYLDSLSDTITDINDLHDKDFEAYPVLITEQMILYTQAVNDNTDRDYIRSYIENMRARDAYDYRMFISNNRPGMDFKFTVNIPESDGGGSFETFLRLDDTLFINV